MWPYYSDLLNKNVPRYTSYPTAAEFSPSVGAEAQAAALASVPNDARLSLYVHIPFCRTICWYCGCNTGAAGHEKRRLAYVEALLQDINRVAARLEARGQVASIHFGGGSPNALPAEDLSRIVAALRQKFTGAEAISLDMELDPRGLTRDYIAAISRLGVKRVSLGVQSFAPHVQRAVNRIQPFDMIAQCCTELRAQGIAAINFDLIYGLPYQSLQDIEDSIAQSLELAPESFAVFGYAHLPSMIARQRAIDAEALPDLEARFAQSACAYQLLVQAGYHAIGFDHFSKSETRLARAAHEGYLRRNFQGFTDDQSDVIIGLGASAISHFGHVILQNEKMSGHYVQCINHAQLPAIRGVRLNDDDKLRAAIIEKILCFGEVALDRVAPLIDFASELESIRLYEALGLLKIDNKHIFLTEHGLPYARIIASVFDKYRMQSQHVLSKAV